jgi:hypothetical protein
MAREQRHRHGSATVTGVYDTQASACPAVAGNLRSKTDAKMDLWPPSPSL